MGGGTLHQIKHDSLMPPTMELRPILGVPAGLLLFRVAAGLALYTLCWTRVPPDFIVYLEPWFQTILSKGRIGAFAEPFSNYSPPYLYLLSFSTLLAPVLPVLSIVKLLSVACTALLAASVAMLLRACKVERPLLPALAVFVLPGAVINAPLLGQCDALWSAACIVSIAAAIEHAHVRMLIWAGIAFAIKAQSAFFAPFIFVTLVARRVPITWWALPVAAYFAMMLPALLAGWPLSNILKIYYEQAVIRVDGGNLANPWIFYPLLGLPHGSGLWVGYLGAGAFCATYFWALRNRTLGPREMIAAALLTAFVAPFLLPKMHERFWFLADILSYALAIVGRDRRSLSIAIAVQGASILALGGYIVDGPELPMIGMPVALFAIALILPELWPRAFASFGALKPLSLRGPKAMRAP